MFQSRLVYSASLLMIASVGVVACTGASQNSESSPATMAATQSSTGSATNTNTSATPVDRPAEFCQNISNLKNLRTNIAEELGVFCTGTTPTEAFKQLYTDAAAQDPLKQPDPALFETEGGIVEGDDGYSQIQLFFSFVAPSIVENLRKAPLVDSLAAEYKSETLQQTATSSVNPADSLDASGLHFLSADITYNMTIFTDTNSNLTNQRKTQFNLYQVKGGNENLGIAVEHLLETNKDYTRATMINIALSTPDNKNAVIVTMLNYSLAHLGLHKTAVASIKEVAKNAGAALYRALTAK